MIQHFIDKALLISEDVGLVPLVGSREEKRLAIQTGVIRIRLSKARIRIGIIDIIFGIVGVDLPAIAVLIDVIEAIPDFYLHKNVSPSGLFQKSLEPRPIHEEDATIRAFSYGHH